MSLTKFPMTRQGFEQLTRELQQLKDKDRPQVIAAIADARRHGDLSENAEYHAAKEKQKNLERRISAIEKKLSSSQIIEVKPQANNAVVFGAKIDLEDLDTGQKRTFQIVGEDEASISQGLISFQSPLARGLLGKTKGDDVEINTPGGLHQYTILNVTYA